MARFGKRSGSPVLTMGVRYQRLVAAAFDVAASFTTDDDGPPVEVAYQPHLPPESFDLIIVDECHPSIYNKWKQVLDYFNAFLKHTGCGELGATSPDGKFTVIEVECLGACGFPTVVLIDNDFTESVTPEKVPELVARYK